MLATTVTYAAVLNKAADMYGTSQALIQAIMDVSGATLPPIPDKAQDFAQEYALVNRPDIKVSAWEDPESFIMGVARWMSYMMQRLDNQWRVVEEFYGAGPVGRIAVLHLASGPYEHRRRQWT